MLKSLVVLIVSSFVDFKCSNAVLVCRTDKPLTLDRCATLVTKDPLSMTMPLHRLSVALAIKRHTINRFRVYRSSHHSHLKMLLYSFTHPPSSGIVFLLSVMVIKSLWGLVSPLRDTPSHSRAVSRSRSRRSRCPSRGWSQVSL